LSNRDRYAVGLLFTLLLASCGQSPNSTGSSATPSAPASTTATTQRPSVEIEVRPCTSSPPRDWSLLCRSVELLAELYVDPLDPAELAAAAVLGVEQAGETDSSEVVGDTFRCTVPDEAFERFCDAVLDRLRSGDGDTADLVDAGVSGMFRYALDPFSTYLAPDFAEQFGDLGSGVVYDLGMSVSARSDGGDVCGVIDGDCRLRVVNVFSGTPAAGAGVLVDDVIGSVDGAPMVGLSASEATALLYGRPGVAVELEIERPTGTLVKTLIREDFRFDPIEFEMLDPSLAYLRLNEFTQPSAQLVGQVLQVPEVQAAEVMILDLRDNPGGLVLAVQAIASQFLDGGLVMVENGRDYRLEVDVIDGGLASPAMDLIVLVNRGSASASEVLAGVLKERGRATIVGEPTFGKNLVQQVFSSGNGGELRITVARWETPGGTDIGITGLDPDVLVEPDTTGATDPIFEKALEIAGR